MSRRPGPANAALRADILRVLRAATEPLTTEQIITLTHTRPEGSHDRWHWRYYGATYQQLRALDRLGLAIWHSWTASIYRRERAHPGAFDGLTRWSAAPYDEETGITIADLEQLQQDEP